VVRVPSATPIDARNKTHPKSVAHDVFDKAAASTKLHASYGAAIVDQRSDERLQIPADVAAIRHRSQIKDRPSAISIGSDEPLFPQVRPKACVATACVSACRNLKDRVPTIS